MKCVIKRKSINVFNISLVFCAFVVLIAAPKVATSFSDYLIYFLLIIGLMIPISGVIYTNKKYGKTVIEIDKNTIKYTNYITGKVNEIALTDIVGITTKIPYKKEYSYLGIFVDSSKVDEIGTKCYISDEHDETKCTDDNYNAILVEINILNSKISNKKIKKKIEEYIECLDDIRIVY